MPTWWTAHADDDDDDAASSSFESTVVGRGDDDIYQITFLGPSCVAGSIYDVGGDRRHLTSRLSLDARYARRHYTRAVVRAVCQYLDRSYTRFRDAIDVAVGDGYAGNVSRRPDDSVVVRGQFRIRSGVLAPVEPSAPT
jgi:hypothetical protein